MAIRTRIPALVSPIEPPSGGSSGFCAFSRFTSSSFKYLELFSSRGGWRARSCNSSLIVWSLRVWFIPVARWPDLTSRRCSWPHVLAAYSLFFASTSPRICRGSLAFPSWVRIVGYRNDIATLAIMVVFASFPAAGYLMMQEILLAKRQLDEQVEKLQEALRHVRRLQGLLPICMYCHKIRNDEQSWQRIELYISEHSDATFTHGLCPECAQKHYPDLKLQPRSTPGPTPPLQPGRRD